MAEVAELRVLEKTVWSKTLFSFRTTRPEGFRFEAGQFARLGLNPSRLTALDEASDETVFRAYSIVSSPYDEYLEFFSVVVPEGAFTSRLQYLQAGDTLFLEKTPYGFLTLSRYQSPAPKDLWLFATGTGLAPFLSMLQSLEVWEAYEDIVLAYSVRYEGDLAYEQEISELSERFGALVENPARLHFVPIVTRHNENPARLSKRLPELLSTGELEKTVGLALSSDASHVMLCGNPQMVDDTKDALKAMGFSMNRRGEGNIAVENYW